MNHAVSRIIARVVLIIALLALIPVGFGSGGFTVSQELCAEDRNCKKKVGALCFINGQILWDYRPIFTSE